MELGKLISGLIWGISQGLIAGCLVPTLLSIKYVDVKLPIFSGQDLLFVGLGIGVSFFVIFFLLAWFTYDSRFESYIQRFKVGEKTN